MRIFSRKIAVVNIRKMIYNLYWKYLRKAFLLHHYEVIKIELKYIVNSNENGKILKDILKNELHISARLLIKLKTSNSIFVNGESKFVNYVVKENDIITVLINFED